MNETNKIRNIANKKNEIKCKFGYQNIFQKSNPGRNLNP